MIEKREENLENEEYIDLARTVGVKVRNHGDQTHFRNQVDGYKGII